MTLRRTTQWMALVTAAAVLAGCSRGGVSSSDQGFVTGDGTVTLIDQADRKAPEGDVSGESVDGEPVSLAALRGKVVVMPVWGSWCGPCRAEAPMLAAAAADLLDDDIVFLGINSRDTDRAQAAGFQRTFALPYPSLYDPDGASLLAFHGVLPLLTIPAFAFIDAQGRVAARVLGELDRSTLYGVLEDVSGVKDLTP